MFLTPPAEQPGSAHAAPRVQRPQLILSTDLGGPALLALLDQPGVLDQLAHGGYGVAIGLLRFSDEHAAAARLLAERGIHTVAWLILPPEQGFTFNTQNYPQASACYNNFRMWAQENDIHFDAVGLEVAPPEDVLRFEAIDARRLAHRFWLASENMLFPAARTAYIELAAMIHHDGYVLHAYQMPMIADDRRAGTTLVQRALEIVDMPADVDVLMCPSSVPFDLLDGDLGGALIASYGSVADAIGISVGEPTLERPHEALPWPAVRRDLLLAAQYTDTIYIDTLEQCVERELLARIDAVDWSVRATAPAVPRLLVGGLRTALLALLAIARFGLTALAWLGWVLAALLWVQSWRRRRNQ